VLVITSQQDCTQSTPPTRAGSSSCTSSAGACVGSCCGSGCTSSFCNPIRGAKEEGVAFAVAAGNSASDAADYQPACCEDALSKYYRV
jgi:flavin-dependent dehydrogenase